MINKSLQLFVLTILTYTSNAQQSTGPAPEATAAEFKLRFRDVPQLERGFMDGTNMVESICPIRRRLQPKPTLVWLWGVLFKWGI